MKTKKLGHASEIHLGRRLWHCLSGLLIVAIYHFSDFSRTTAALVLGGVFLAFLIVEITRMLSPRFNRFVLWVLRGIMRESEANRISGSTYYLFSAVLVVAIFPKSIAILAILYLAFGDPAASIAGILSRGRGVQFPNGKSLIGLAAGVLVCGSLTYFYLLPELRIDQLVFVSVLGGMIGGFSEFFSFKLDDNITIPIFSGIGLTLVFSLLSNFNTVV